MRSICCGIVSLFAATVPLHAQLFLEADPAPWQMQNMLAGQSVIIQDFVVDCDSVEIQAGLFQGDNCVGIDQGVVLCTGDIQFLPGPNDQLRVNWGVSPFHATPDTGLALLIDRPASSIYNKCALEFDVIPLYDSLLFDYVFASEEYERWACSQYNDAFGFFLSGPGISGPFPGNATNLALIPGTTLPVSINTVNSGLMNANNANGYWQDPFGPCFAADSNWQANAQYYRYNGGEWPFPQPPDYTVQLDSPYCCSPYYIQPNGMTVQLTAGAVVEPLQTYHARLVIGNVLDWRYASSVFLAQHRSPESVPRRSIPTGLPVIGPAEHMAYFNADGLVLRTTAPPGTVLLLLDQAGREVHRFRTQGTLQTEDLPGLKSGLYVVRSTGNRPFAVKVVKP